MIFLNYFHFHCKTIISCSYCSMQSEMILIFTFFTFFWLPDSLFQLSFDCQIPFFNFPLIVRFSFSTFLWLSDSLFQLSSDCHFLFFNFPLIVRSDNPRIGLKRSSDCQIFRKKSENPRSPRWCRWIPHSNFQVNGLGLAWLILNSGRIKILSSQSNLYT